LPSFVLAVTLAAPGVTFTYDWAHAWDGTKRAVDRVVANTIS
jgi:hypothetical protein